MASRKTTFLVVASILLIMSLSEVLAQTEVQQLPTAQAAEIQPASLPDATSPKAEEIPTGMRSYDSESFPSLVFTYWEQVAIEDAKRSRGLNRAPTEAELMRDLQMDGDTEKVKPPPEKRNITLSGIAYKANKKWTIWLNGQRVTPDAIPPEAIDLKVFRNYIEIKWFDEYTNRIIPIRLRPHQRFNIDTRIFLPG